MDYLSKDEADALGEISNISIGSSATAMNKMLGQVITITAPQVELVHRNNVLLEHDGKCILVKVQYTKGLYGNNFLLLHEDDAKIITDLMMGNNGTGSYAEGEITDLHLSAVAEAMNQMTGTSATAMSKMLGITIDISPPNVEYIVKDDYSFDDDIPEELFVKVKFRMKIGKLIDSTIIQLYPFNLAHSIYKLFQRRKY